MGDSVGSTWREAGHHLVLIPAPTPMQSQGPRKSGITTLETRPGLHSLHV